MHVQTIYLNVAEMYHGTCRTSWLGREKAPVSASLLRAPL